MEHTSRPIDSALSGFTAYFLTARKPFYRLDHRWQQRARIGLTLTRPPTGEIPDR